MEKGQTVLPKTKEVVAAIGQLAVEYEKDYLLETNPPPGVLIHVDEIASKVAVLYEKVRQVVDWKEAHLIRRGAIERILKRVLLSEISGIGLLKGLDPVKMAEPLILELIRGGHFRNDWIPQKKIKRIEKILEKYIYYLDHNPLTSEDSSWKLKAKINFYNWILEVAACEIEEELDLPIKEGALVGFMTELIASRMQVSPRDGIPGSEVWLQTYLATQRALFHLDEPILAFRLLRYRCPDWFDFSKEAREKVAKGILQVWEQVEADLAHPLRGDFFEVCEKYDTVYLIIGDILDELLKEGQGPMEEVLKEVVVVEKLIEEVYSRRLKTLKKRLFRSAIYSTLSIFIAGAVSLFLIEVPIAKLVYGRWSALAIAVDILIPTALMFLMVAMVKPPRESNLHRVVMEVKKVLYEEKSGDIYEIQINKKHQVLFTFLTLVIYVWASLVSLGLTGWVFYLANVPPTSLFLDTLNVAVIVFAALVIRQRAKELTVEERVSVGEFFLDILSVPLARLGQWFSAKWREYNIVSVFFIALVDMPFSNFISFIESWSSFLRRKKAGIH